VSLKSWVWLVAAFAHSSKQMKMGKWENGKMGERENEKMGEWENGEMGKCDMVWFKISSEFRIFQASLILNTQLTTEIKS